MPEFKKEVLPDGTEVVTLIPATKKEPEKAPKKEGNEDNN